MAMSFEAAAHAFGQWTQTVITPIEAKFGRTGHARMALWATPSLKSDQLAQILLSVTRVISTPPSPFLQRGILVQHK